LNPTPDAEVKIGAEITFQWPPVSIFILSINYIFAQGHC
jgi:hypothetical protein